MNRLFVIFKIHRFKVFSQSLLGPIRSELLASKREKRQLPSESREHNACGSDDLWQLEKAGQTLGAAIGEMNILTELKRLRDQILRELKMCHLI